MKIIIGIILLIIIVCVVSWIIDINRFVIRNYEFSSPKIKKAFRIVLLSDLHNKDYGNNNESLIKAIDECAPDAIIIAGDLCNGLKGHSFDTPLSLLSALTKKYPLYYGMGNHEYRLSIYPKEYGTMWEDYTQKLAELGVHVMNNERSTIDEVGLDIASVTIDKFFYKRFVRTKLSENDMKGYLGSASVDNYQLLIAHNPEYFEAYSDWGADLTVSGHVHGGIMRLPLVGGIISPRLVCFPKYSDGEYELEDKHMVVSCGLGTHTIHVRVFNPGELSVIDLKPGANGN